MSVPTAHYTLETSGSADFTLRQHLLFGPGNFISSLAAAILFVLVPIRHGSGEALRLAAFVAKIGEQLEAPGRTEHVLWSTCVCLPLSLSVGPRWPIGRSS